MSESYNVTEFCQNEKISRSMFYKLLKLNLAPKIMKIGRLTRISADSVTTWRKQMEKIANNEIKK